VARSGIIDLGVRRRPEPDHADIVVGIGAEGPTALGEFGIEVLELGDDFGDALFHVVRNSGLIAGAVWRFLRRAFLASDRLDT
jgi:hypothetical protein